MEKRDSVFLAWWMPIDSSGFYRCFEGFKPEDYRLIGVYSSRSKAEAAVERAKQFPGIRKHPEGFIIDEYELDQDNWTSGFSFGDASYHPVT